MMNVDLTACCVMQCGYFSSMFSGHVTARCVMQCGYFSSMFSGQWKEADENCVTIDIPDENIDEEGMSTIYVIV